MPERAGRARPRDAGPDERASREVERLRRLATLLDAAYRVPGTEFRVGLDPLIGLAPVAGDIATALVSLWIVHRSRRLGASRATLLRMLRNVVIDLLAGAVPVLGDAVDAAWKANLANVDLLERDLRERGAGRGRPAK